jgi:hypothetical protein
LGTRRIRYYIEDEGGGLFLGGDPTCPSTSNAGGDTGAVFYETQEVITVSHTTFLYSNNALMTFLAEITFELHNMNKSSANPYHSLFFPFIHSIAIYIPT